jgi:thiamine kinase-like enzyme
VFCKYDSAPFDNRSHGHRAGLLYEAEVYRKVLRRLSVSIPRLFGVHRENEVCASLVLEFIDGKRGIEFDSNDLQAAARWLGKFHAAAERLLLKPPADLSLKEYDHAFYAGWARRTLLFSRKLERDVGWLPVLCKAFERSAIDLLRQRRTVIHGEFYPSNLLMYEGRLYPVDWESAAVASGEIDLASLTLGWPDADVSACLEEYSQSRWNRVASAELATAFVAARMYTTLRWLGDCSAWTTDPESLWLFDVLKTQGEALHLL